MKVLVRAPGHWLFVGKLVSKDSGEIVLQDAENIRTYSGGLTALCKSRENTVRDTVGAISLTNGPGVFVVTLPDSW